MSSKTQGSTSKGSLDSRDDQLFERLAHTGRLASECGLIDEAERIFTALRKIRPHSQFSAIGLASVQSRKGMTEQAIQGLRNFVADSPDSYMARALLGVLLFETQQEEAKQIFDQVLKGSDEDAMRVVKMCMDYDKGETKSTTEPAAASSSESLEYFRHHNRRV